MKKAILVFISVFFAFQCFAAELVSESPVVPQKVYVSENEVKNLNSLSPKEFDEDLDSLCYLLQSAYIGYDDMIKKGFDIEKFKLSLKNKFAEKDDIQTSDFVLEICRFLSEYVNDSHFSLVKDNFLYKPSAQKIIAFTKVYVKKIEGEYVVKEDEWNEAGKIYTGPAENLFLYPAKGEDIFRVGVLLDENDIPDIKKFKFSFDNDEMEISVKAEFPSKSPAMGFSSSVETENSGYVSINTFFPSYDQNQKTDRNLVQINKFLRKSVEWQDKQNIIIDLRGNTGGYPFFPARFLLALYDGYKDISASLGLSYATDEWSNSLFDVHELSSPCVNEIILQRLIFAGQNTFGIFKDIEEQKENPRRLIYKHDAVLMNWGENHFGGKIIFITDKNVSSAAEWAILQFKEAFGEQVFVVGTNTGGVLETGNIFAVFLPNSGIKVQFGNMKYLEINDFYPEWHGETFGIFPDYWSASKDLNETIYKITGDKKMKKKLKNFL